MIWASYTLIFFFHLGLVDKRQVNASKQLSLIEVPHLLYKQPISTLVAEPVNKGI